MNQPINIKKAKDLPIAPQHLEEFNEDL